MCHKTISLHAPLEQLAAHDYARAMVRDAAHQFAADTAAEPAIVALRSHVFDVLDDELARAATPEVERALKHFASVLVHAPSVRARELAAEGRLDEFIAGLSAVFDVAPGVAASAEARREAGGA